MFRIFFNIKAVKLKGSRIYNVAVSAFWLIAGVGIGKVLALVSTYFLTGILMAEGYGKLGIVLSTVGLFSTIGGIGLASAATKYIAEYKLADKLKAANIVVLCEIVIVATSGFMSAMFFLLSPIIAETIYKDSSLVDLLRIASVYMFFLTMNTAQIGTLAGLEAFKLIAINNLCSSLIGFPLIIMLCYHFELTGVLIGYSVMCLGQYFLNLISIKKKCKEYELVLTFKVSGLIAEWEIINKFIIPTALSGFISMPVVWLCDTMLAKADNGYLEMAIYSAASQWRAFILFIPQNIAIVLLPVLSSLFGGKNMREYKYMFNISIISNFLIAALTTVPLLIFSEKIMSGYGAEFSSRGSVFMVTLATSVIMVLNEVIGKSIASQGRMWMGFAFNLAWAIALLGSSYVLVVQNDYGAVGLTTAYLIAYILHSIWQYVFVVKNAKNLEM
ncbi:oligosaccharide flippase family protein [Paenibacillus xanthanilyticus]|uniref:Oligosaccharide flippase family protein n=1 Tax=Paenibacillus xanthanilyticus TaxID=1783531 RepID=A0ABV8K326_9BACL